MRRANGRANGRVGGKPRVLRDIAEPFRRPPIRPLPVRLPDRNGGFPRLSAMGRTASRVASDVPHRYATRVLAESLGKPSLWVIINAPWY